MPTSLLSIASSSLSVRFKEPFLSDGLNQKFAPHAPGIYAGFRLKPSATNMSVDVTPDTLGASQAFYRNSLGRSIGIRTVGTVTLNLTAKASKTVVVCIYAQYSTTATTAAEFRMYELSPSNEFTAAPDRDYLVVLGTVVVPASGLILANSISSGYRTYAGDAQAPQLAPRTQVIDDPYFSMGNTGATAFYQTSVYKALLTQGWTAWAPATSDGFAAVVNDVTTKTLKAIQLGVATSGGARTANLRLVTDVGQRFGDLAEDDWIDVFCEYEILVTSGTANFSVEVLFYDTPNNDPFTKSIALPTATSGVRAVQATFRVSDLLSDDFARTPTNPIYLWTVRVVYVDSFSSGSAAANITLRELRVTVPNVATAEGNASADPRAGRLFGSYVARAIRFFNENSNPNNLYQPAYDAPTLMTDEVDSNLHLVLPDGGYSAQTGLHAGGQIRAGAAAMNDVVPRYRASHNDSGTTLSVLFESQANLVTTFKHRLLATADELYITVNAKPTSGNGWQKDVNGSAATGVKISFNGTIRLLKQAGGTNTWADASWDDSGDALTLDVLTSLWADSTGISATTLWAMLNELISDLAAVAGTGRIGHAAVGNSAQVTALGALNLLERQSFANWVTASVPLENTLLTPTVGAIEDTAFGNSTYVAVGGDPNLGDGETILTYSSDGRLWTMATPGGGATASDTYYDVVYKNSLFVAVGANTQSSPDGITWTLQATAPAAQRSVDFGAGVWVTVSRTSNVISRSANLVTWANTAVTAVLNKVRFLNGLFVAVGSGIYTSPDGITWSLRATPTNEMRDVAYDNGVYLAVGVQRRIYRSTNATSWTEVTQIDIASSATWTSIAAVPGKAFVIVGHGNVRRISFDGGLTWVESASANEREVYTRRTTQSVRYLNTQLFFGGTRQMGWIRRTPPFGTAISTYDQSTWSPQAFTGVIAEGSHSFPHGDLEGTYALGETSEAGEYRVRNGNYTWPVAYSAPHPDAVVTGQKNATGAPSVAFEGPPTWAGSWENFNFFPYTAGTFALSAARLTRCTVTGSIDASTTTCRLQTVTQTGGTDGQAYGLRLGSASSGYVGDSTFSSNSVQASPQGVLYSQATTTTLAWTFERSSFVGGRSSGHDWPAFRASSAATPTVFRDCTFSSTSTTFAGYLVDISGSTGLVFENCRFTSATGQILKASLTGATFRDCYFESGSNTAGVTDPIYLLGCGVGNTPLVFENCFFKVGTANITTSVAATRAWWCLGQGTTSTTIDGGVSGRFSVKNCRVEVPSAASALHRGTNMVFVGSEGDASPAVIDGLDINLSSRAFSSAGSQFNGYGNFNGTAFLHLAGRYALSSGLFAKKVRLRNYAGVSANVACSLFVFEGVGVEDFETITVAGAAFSHTNEVGVIDGATVTRLYCNGIPSTYRATGACVWSLQNYAVLEDSVLSAGNVLPSSAYISVTTADVTVRGTKLDIEPTVSSSTVPLIRISGVLHLISENRFRNVFIDATHAPVLINTSDGTRILGNELVFGCNFSGTPVLSSTGARCIVASNLVGSTQANSSSVTISGSGTFDGGNAQTQSIPYN